MATPTPTDPPPKAFAVGDRVVFNVFQSGGFRRPVRKEGVIVEIVNQGAMVQLAKGKPVFEYLADLYHAPAEAGRVEIIETQPVKGGR